MGLRRATALRKIWKRYEPEHTPEYTLVGLPCSGHFGVDASARPSSGQQQAVRQAGEGAGPDDARRRQAAASRMRRYAGAALVGADLRRAPPLVRIGHLPGLVRLFGDSRIRSDRLPEPAEIIADGLRAGSSAGANEAG